MKILYLRNWFDRMSPLVKYHNNSRMLEFICNSLTKNGAEIELIDPKIGFDLPNKIRHAFYKHIFKKRHLRWSDPSLLKHEAKIRNKIINESNADAVFSFSNHSLAYLETNKIKSYWTDICFAQQQTNNPSYINLTNTTIKNSNKIEELSAQKIDAAFFTSNWARTAIQNNYPIDKNKLHVAFLGPDLVINHTFSDVEKFIEKKINNKICKLLIIGWNYKIKGIDTGIAITKRLNEMGFEAEILVIGCQLDKNIINNKIQNIKFLNKNNPAEYHTLCNFLSEANFFLTPATFDCTPHTICENNAFGVPVIATKVGGVPEMITDNVNGITFELGTNIDNYCNFIIDTFNNKTRYKELCVSSFNEYNTKLNWDYGTKIIMDKLREIKTNR